jgi:feruloyl esterase
MSRFAGTLIAAVALNAHPHAQVSSATASTAADRCSALSALRLADVRVTDARYAAANAAATGPVHAAHCRATGFVGGEIGFSVWLPDDWNGRFLMLGGGGFVGSIPGPGGAVDRGFAVTSTDTGHQADGITARWAQQNLERQLNFGYLGVHRTAETARSIVRQYYGSDPHHAYHVGCSSGGRQGLMEAQRFPQDFDGIVSGAPVFDWTRALAAGVKNAQAAFPDPTAIAKPVITPDTLKLLQARVLQACDAKDGVADGVIDDPTKCTFDVASIPACADDAPGADCLTRAQRAVIQKVYRPLTDDRGVVYEGQPVGAEAWPNGWQTWITGPNDRAFAATGQPSLIWAFATEFFKYFVFGDPSWDYSRYDVAKSWRRDTQALTPFLNAESPDLTAFRARHGKLLLWHGWADPALNPLATIRYYKDVVTRDPQAAEDVRLFLLPGVLHCGGGPGPGQFDPLTAIVDWIEKGTAPSSLVVRKAAAGDQPARSRPVCAYPAKAAYKGAGSTDDAANFVCR